MASFYVDVDYNLLRKELRLRFPTSSLARTYQIYNGEARILAPPEGDKAVWLPLPEDMLSIRWSLKHGMAFCFSNARSAQVWSERLRITQMYDDSSSCTEVIIQTKWTEASLKDRFSSKQMLAPPRPPPSRARSEETRRHNNDNGFGVDPQQGSRSADRYR